MASYTINELSERTGTKRRNIYFYVQQRLLPPPKGAGLGARYDDEHVMRLQAIPILRKRGLKLDEIRERLTHMKSGSIKRLIGGYEPEQSEALAGIPARRAKPMNYRAASPPPQADSLRRYTLAKGVELLVDSTNHSAIHGHIPQLAQAVKQILRGSRKPRQNGDEQ